MAEIKAEKINGSKYFFYKNRKGEWIGSLKIQDFFSRTFLPVGTEYKVGETEELIINILKTDKVPLKRENLDKETIVKLEKAGVTITGNVAPVEGGIIKKSK